MQVVMALLAAAAFTTFATAVALNVRGLAPTRRWMPAAALSAAFAAFSVVTLIHEGPTGFWVEHTRNLWGNQIWFDLLLAVGVAWVMMVPRARSVGMNPLPWLVLVMCTGCIGLCAMLARVLYLEDSRASR